MLTLPIACCSLPIPCAVGISNGANGDIVGLDPKLGPLQDNGGPTPTMALLAGSPAIDTGANPLGLTADQRGFVPRTAGAGTDMGAVELGATALNTGTGGGGTGGGGGGTVVAPPPAFVSEQRVTVGKGRARTTVFQLNFNAPLNATAAQATGHYHVVQIIRAATKKRPAKTKGIPVRAAQYNPGSNSVTLTLGRYTALNQLRLTATGLIGVTGVSAATIVTKL